MVNFWIDTTLAIIKELPENIKNLNPIQYGPFWGDLRMVTWAKTPQCFQNIQIPGETP